MRCFASFTLNGKTIHLGSFDTEEEAALAYNKAMLLHYGQYARLNIVTGDNMTRSELLKYISSVGTPDSNQVPNEHQLLWTSHSGNRYISQWDNENWVTSPNVAAINTTNLYSDTHISAQVSQESADELEG